MGYSQINSIIRKWVDRHKLSLFTKIDGIEDYECRSVFISSQNGECCQIWIDAPKSRRVHIHIADVETKDDEELLIDWDVPIEKLEETL